MKQILFYACSLCLLLNSNARASENSFFDYNTYFEDCPFVYDSSIVNGVNANRTEFISQALLQLDKKRNVEPIIFMAALLNIKELKQPIISADTNSKDIELLRNLYLYLVFNSSDSYIQLKGSITDTTYYSDTYSTVVVTVLSYDRYFFNIFVNKEHSDALEGETFAEAQTWLLYLLNGDKTKYILYRNNLKNSKYKKRFIEHYKRYSKQMLPFEKKVGKKLLSDIK
jgi:hypothetical protein